MQLEIDGEARLVSVEEKSIEVRYFDERRRLVRHHRFIPAPASRVFLDWARELEYDEEYDAMVRDRSWRLFPTGEVWVDASDREKRTAGEAQLEGQDVSAFTVATPEFGDYAALIDFAPKLPEPKLRWRDTGM